MKRSIVKCSIPVALKKTLSSGASLGLDVNLRMMALDIEEMVVTILNVVYSEKIQELPDQNASESISRLPGVAVQRDAGEVAKVVVRGFSQKFSSVTVNGKRIPIFVSFGR